jgi:hypothetical protein
MVIMVMVMVAGVYDHHNLRLRRVGQCEAEEKNQAEPNLFHTLLWPRASPSAELP